MKVILLGFCCLLLVACSKKNEPNPSPGASTPAPAVEPTSEIPDPAPRPVTEDTPQPRSEDPAVAPARQAVVEAGLIDAAWLAKARVKVITSSNVVEITFLPEDRRTYGRSAVVKLKEDDLSIIDIQHFR